MRGSKIKVADPEGLRAFLLFQGLGQQPLYFEELLRKDRIFTVIKGSKTHFYVLHYRLRRSNFERYFIRV